MKQMLIIGFVLLSWVANAQRVETTQLWKQVYQHYMQDDLYLNIQIKNRQEYSQQTLLLDSTTISFIKKGANTFYQSKEQDILTTPNYYIWVSRTDSILTLREKNKSNLPSFITQLEKLDSLLQLHPLDLREDANYWVFSTGSTKYSTEIYVHQSDKTIHKIIYTYPSETSKIYTEVSYTNNLLSSLSPTLSFDVENYITKKRKGWKLNELYKNYTLVVE